MSKAKTQSTASKTKKKTSTRTPKLQSLRANIPTELKSWLVEKAEEKGMTQSDLVCKILAEAKTKGESQFIDQIRLVVQEEIAKLQKNIQQSIQVKVVSHLQDEWEDARESLSEAVSKGKAAFEKVTSKLPIQ